MSKLADMLAQVQSQGSTSSDFETRALLAALTGSGFQGRPQDLKPCDSDLDFVRHYLLKLERQPVDLGDRYKHLAEVYADNSRHTVLQFSAQAGKTGRMFTWMLRRMILEWGALCGYYLPDYKLAGPYSQQRFTPFIRSNTTIAKYVGAPTSDSKGQDAVLTKTLGPSALYWLSTAGRSSTEGLPLRVVAMDEIRRMEGGDIERVHERMSAQADPWLMMVSTAGVTDGTIDRYFKDTDQRFFHCATSTDLDGVSLASEFPHCIEDLRKATPLRKRQVAHAFTMAGIPYCNMTDEDATRFPEACYIHPRTGEIIVDPREGWYEPHAVAGPDGKLPWRRGFHLSQLNAWNHPAGRILDKFERARDMAEFYNSCLGLTYTDESRRPVKQEHLEGSQDSSLFWPMNMGHAWRRENLQANAMGVDVQHGYLVAVIKERAPSGRFRTIHAEIVYDGDPGRPVAEGNGWTRLGRLMHEYNVKCCVIDMAPLFDSALHFAKAHKGIVFLASYGDDAEIKDIANWLDSSDPATRKGQAQTWRFSVRINRTKALQWSLGRWSHWENETPPAGGLIQLLPVVGDKVRLSSGLRQGEWEPRPIIRDLYWPHQRGIIFRDIYDEDDDAQRLGKHRTVAEHMGDDPHFAHADLYCNLALDRLRR